MPSLLHQNHSEAEYQDYVFQKMHALHIGKAAADQTIYVLFVPCKSPYHLGAGCLSHHPSLDPNRAAPGGGSEGTLFVKGDSIAVDLGLPAVGVDTQTTQAGHETAEAMTNTAGVEQYRFHTDHPETPWLDSPPWIRASGTIELADLAGGTHWYEHVSTGETFAFQRIYSNKASRANGDPDVPPSPSPYYSVFTEKDWLPFSGATHADVAVRAWAAAALPRWNVTASVAVWRNKKSGAPDPCRLRTTTFNVQNGTSFDVKVDISHPDGPTSWCTIELKSEAVPTKHRSAGVDDSHFWDVGLMIGKP
jgi:hypothetical protein